MIFETKLLAIILILLGDRSLIVVSQLNSTCSYQILPASIYFIEKFYKVTMYSI